MSISSATYYDDRVARRAPRYAAARFEDVHQHLLGYLPATGATVLDIGAGSGRDAYALDAAGYRVTAVEPSLGMREWALARAPVNAVHWIDDALPGLAKTLAEKRRFDFILCSAVLIHVAPKALAQSFNAMGALAAPGGMVAVSLRPPLAADPPHIFHNHLAKSVESAAHAAGLELRDEGSATDILGRDSVIWRWFVFQASV